MKYSGKGVCEGCDDYTWVRADRFQGVVCKNCDEVASKFKKPKHRDARNDDFSLELYPKTRKAI